MFVYLFNNVLWGKNNHNFPNNEIKSSFFLFLVQKTCCAFAQFIFLLYICVENQICGRTQTTHLILIVVNAQHSDPPITIIGTREAETKQSLKQWPKKSESRIAERAGVSVGTVDRVLHDRPNVSKPAREKVEQALKEMNYQPNMYASALAYNKSYTFYLLIPKHESEAYWEEIEEGARKCEDVRRDFHIDVEIRFYERSNEESFREVGNDIFAQGPEGVIVVPSSLEVTREFTEKLHQHNIPFILLDSYMPDLRPLSFFGQDSFCSGFFAAKMLMMIAYKEKEIMLMRQTKDGRVVSKQQDNREVGFRHYMHDHFPQVKIIDLDLPLNGTRAEYTKMMEKYFAEHPDTHHCMTMTSKAHIVGDFLLKTNRRDVQIMGYDMVEKNARCLREGSISFLIAQHAYMQGYSCVETLFRAIVLKKKVTPVNYMPIELLMKENVDFYRRTQL